MKKALAKQLKKDVVMPILDGNSADESVMILQKIFLSPPQDMDAALLDKIQLQFSHKDLGVRFWAKKVFQRYSFQFFKEDPERFSETEEENRLPLDILCKMLGDVKKSKFLAMKVLKKLCHHNSPQALDILLKYLKTTGDPYQISFLTKNLGIHFPSDALIGALVPFLSHQDERVVANTIEGLEVIGSPKCFEIIANFLKHRNNRVRANAAKAIANFDTQRAFDILMKMLSSKGQSHQIISACHAIKELKDAKFFPCLQELLHDDLALDDVLSAMVAINQARTQKILEGHVEKTERRLQKIKGLLPKLDALESRPNELQQLRHSPIGLWFAKIDWVDLLHSRVFWGMMSLFLLVAGLATGISRYQSPDMAKAREELSRSNVNFTNQDFLQAFETKNLPVIDLFLKAGISVRIKNENGATPLHFAAFSGEVALVGKLLESGAAIDAVDQNGLSPLHLSTTLAVAEKLMVSGANYFARDNKGKTPLHRMAENGRSDIMELLLSKGVDINAQGLYHK